ncbi:PRC-barrel domain-containing protein [Proteinivorax hydrogeniformans]|uniref:PRC-barrel domain-containing protein n=1 Tax=Proteinivorax hydrogeniformans TaxID=1826727 RepID=A0AAU8HWB6_9FIRM
MIYTKKVLGLEVINLSDGKKIGKIKEVIFDNKSKKVVAIEIYEKTGLWKKTSDILPIEELKGMGKDSVTVDEPKTVEEINKGLTNFKWSSLSGRKVIEEDGSIIGTVSDISFKFPEGDIVEVEVNQAKSKVLASKETVSIERVRAIGEDAIIVYNE